MQSIKNRGLNRLIAHFEGLCTQNSQSTFFYPRPQCGEKSGYTCFFLAPKRAMVFQFCCMHSTGIFLLLVGLQLLLGWMTGHVCFKLHCYTRINPMQCITYIYYFLKFSDLRAQKWHFWGHLWTCVVNFPTFKISIS